MCQGLRVRIFWNIFLFIKNPILKMSLESKRQIIRRKSNIRATGFVPKASGTYHTWWRNPRVCRQRQADRTKAQCKHTAHRSLLHAKNQDMAYRDSRTERSARSYRSEVSRRNRLLTKRYRRYQTARGASAGSVPPPKETPP